MALVTRHILIQSDVCVDPGFLHLDMPLVVHYMWGCFELEGEDLQAIHLYITVPVMYKVFGSKGISALPKAQQSMKTLDVVSRTPVRREADCPSLRSQQRRSAI